MNIIALGGWMMWPLLAVSILALTVIVERLLLYASCGLPDDGLRAALVGRPRQAARTAAHRRGPANYHEDHA